MTINWIGVKTAPTPPLATRLLVRTLGNKFYPARLTLRGTWLGDNSKPIRDVIEWAYCVNASGEQMQ